MKDRAFIYIGRLRWYVITPRAIWQVGLCWPRRWPGQEITEREYSGL